MKSDDDAPFEPIVVRDPGNRVAGRPLVQHAIEHRFVEDAVDHDVREGLRRAVGRPELGRELIEPNRHGSRLRASRPERR